jgi:DNA-binding HxlR family transcriptional regulator
MPGQVVIRPLDQSVECHQIPHDQVRHVTSTRLLAFCKWLQPYQTDAISQVVFEEGRMNDFARSGCPINLTLEVVGDKWSLLIIRDIMFGNRRHYRELLTKSDEGISSNILADRLRMLLDRGILTRQDDPGHKQKGIFSLTEQGIEMLPILAQMASWGVKYLPVSEELGIRAQLLSDGGPKMWAEFMDELRETHLGIKRRKRAGLSVGGQLQAAYEAVMATRKTG